MAATTRAGCNSAELSGEAESSYWFASGKTNGIHSVCMMDESGSTQADVVRSVASFTGLYIGLLQAFFFSNTLTQHLNPKRTALLFCTRHFMPPVPELGGDGASCESSLSKGERQCNLDADDLACLDPVKLFQIIRNYLPRLNPTTTLLPGWQDVLTRTV